MFRPIDRRALLAAAGLTLCAPRGVWSAPARKTLALELVASELALRAGQPPTLAWRFADATPPRFAQGDEVEITVANRLPIGVWICWRGLDGAPDLEPLLVLGAIPSGGTRAQTVAFRHAGTLICDARSGHDGATPAAPMLPIIVSETTPIAADRDETVLIEDWRLAAGPDAPPPIWTINGRINWELTATRNDRLRLRFINGAQRSVIAIQCFGLNPQVLAIDGQPAEPFPARDGRLVMAQGTRIDVLVDVVGDAGAACPIMLDDGRQTQMVGQIAVEGRPRRSTPLAPQTALPSNGLPDRLALQTALRVDVRLESAAGWAEPATMTSAMPPAFRVKRGRAVVLALANRGDEPIVFHLHGHHMRLLDRLDDGWKPFWLDTLAVPGKQTLRVAFAATEPGRYLMEAMGTTAASPCRVQSYFVDR